MSDDERLRRRRERQVRHQFDLIINRLFRSLLDESTGQTYG